MTKNLYDAAKTGDLGRLKQELNRPDININYKHTANNNGTPLHAAAAKGHIECLQELIAKGAQVEAQDQAGWTPLHLAAQNGYIKYLKELIAKGTTVDVPNKAGLTPLHLAAQNGQTECLKELIAKGARVDAQNKAGWTPLHLSAWNGHIECLKELIAKGAKVEVQNKACWTPLHLAAENGHTGCLKELIAKGATVDVPNKAGWTPLHVAAENGHIECLKELIAKGATVGVQDKFGWTPLLAATQNSHIECLKELIAKGATVDVQNEACWTPLHVAAENGHTECLKELIAKGATVDVPNKAGWTPLHLAAENGHIACAIELVNKDANLEAIAKDGFSTPLVLAIRHNHYKLIAEVTEKNPAKISLDSKLRVFINQQDKLNESLLHYAVALGYIKCLEVLLKLGADPAAKNLSGKTPLDVAIDNNQPITIAKLIEAAPLRVADETLLSLEQYLNNNINTINIDQFVLGVIYKKFYFLKMHQQQLTIAEQYKIISERYFTEWVTKAELLVLRKSLNQLNEEGKAEGVQQFANAIEAKIEAKLLQQFIEQQTSIEEKKLHFQAQKDQLRANILALTEEDIFSVNSMQLKDKVRGIKANLDLHDNNIVDFVKNLELLIKQIINPPALIPNNCLDELKENRYINNFRALWRGDKLYLESTDNIFASINQIINLLENLLSRRKQVSCIMPGPEMAHIFSMLSELLISYRKYIENLCRVSKDISLDQSAREKKLEQLTAPLCYSAGLVDHRYLQNQPIIAGWQLYLASNDVTKIKIWKRQNKSSNAILLVSTNSAIFTAIVRDAKTNKFLNIEINQNHAVRALFNTIQSLCRAMQAQGKDCTKAILQVDNSELLKLDKGNLILSAILDAANQAPASVLIPDNTGISIKPNEYGIHKVIRYANMHFKYHIDEHTPILPGIEYMVNSFYAVIAGYGTAPTELIRITSKDKVDVTLLVSQTVDGKNLRHILEKWPDYVNKVDQYNFSTMAIGHLLVYPEDGKADNHIAKFEKSAANENEIVIKIIGIDNEIAFAAPLVKNYKNKYSAAVKSVFFFFPQMHHMIDAKFREQFLNRKAELILIEWLDLLVEKNSEYNKLIENKAFTLKLFSELGLPIKFTPGTISSLYLRIRKIQKLLTDKHDLTHWQLFNEINPALALIYQQIQGKHPDNILACEDELYNKSAENVAEALAIKYSKDKDKCFAMHATALNDLKSPEHFTKTRTQPVIKAAEEFISEIDFNSFLTPEVGELILNRLAKFNGITTLQIKNCKALNEHNFVNIMRQFTQLKSLYLIGCHNIDAATIATILKPQDEDKNIELGIYDCRKINPHDYLFLQKRFKINIIAKEQDKYIILPLPLAAANDVPFGADKRSFLHALLVEKREICRSQLGFLQNIEVNVDAAVPERLQTNPSLARYTPLHMAAKANNVGMVELLIAVGANVNAKGNDEHEYTPLDQALRYNAFKTATELKKSYQAETQYNYETTIKKKASECIIQCFREHKRTVVLKDKPELTDNTLMLLLKNFNNLNTLILINTPQITVGGIEQALVKAVASRKINLLIAFCEQISLKSIASLGHKIILLEHPIQTNLTRQMHEELMKDKCNLKLLHLLLLSGADVNAVSSLEVRSNFTALHLAIIKRNFRAVVLLLKFGANINIEITIDNSVKTALQLAQMPEYYCQPIITLLTKNNTTSENVVRQQNVKLSI